MDSIVSRTNVNKTFRFISNMFMIFIFTKVLSIHIESLFISIGTTVISLWLCARSINSATREINPKDMNEIKRRIDEAFVLMLLSVLVFHFSILLMFLSFIRSTDYVFIIYKICYLTVFELIPLFTSCIFLFLRWKENMKPKFVKLSNYVSYFTMICLLIWVVYVFKLIWGDELSLLLSKNYTPIIICYGSAIALAVFGLLAVLNVPQTEINDIYETKRINFSKMNEKPLINNNNTNNNNNSKTDTIQEENKDETKKDL